MFEFKYQIELKTSEIINLFGESFFGDKSTFWKAHQTSLNYLYDQIIKTGYPVKIKDLESNRSIIIKNLDDFHFWLKANQPFNFNRINEKGNDKS